MRYVLYRIQVALRDCNFSRPCDSRKSPYLSLTMSNIEYRLISTPSCIKKDLKPSRLDNLGQGQDQHPHRSKPSPSPTHPDTSRWERNLPLSPKTTRQRPIPTPTTTPTRTKVQRPSFAHRSVNPAPTRPTRRKPKPKPKPDPTSKPSLSPSTAPSPTRASGRVRAITHGLSLPILNQISTNDVLV